jgi:nitroimidazol reductase NimA-like FMN-containing flavoprotein (pyridoxamine 5'-phosphate oxidase superfamily)
MSEEMTEQPENTDYTKLRREDRGKDDEWIREFVRTAPFGFLATQNDGQPFVNMNTFVYDEESHSIFLHTAGNGRLRTNIDGDDKVCFAIGEMGRFLPAEVAREFSVEYAGVIIFGRGSVISDATYARDKMQALNNKYFPHLTPGKDYRPITPKEIHEISAYQIRIDSWSGKKKQEAEDFPGAFLFGEVRDHESGSQPE